MGWFAIHERQAQAIRTGKQIKEVPTVVLPKSEPSRMAAKRGSDEMKRNLAVLSTLYEA